MAVLDSTRYAESQISKSRSNTVAQAQSQALMMVPLTNYALQATVSAESTYPGYSMSKIKDGDRNTTVGPSYSWANNFPAGGKLPESVFLILSSVKSINRVDIYTSSGYELQNYTIQYRASSNGIWVTLVTYHWKYINLQKAQFYRSWCAGGTSHLPTRA